jgi:hypothetical protein
MIRYHVPSCYRLAPSLSLSPCVCACVCACVRACGCVWAQVSPETVTRFYELYAVCRRSPPAGHGLRQCLADLAALRGDVFPGEPARLGYHAPSPKYMIYIYIYTHTLYIVYSI